MAFVVAVYSVSHVPILDPMNYSPPGFSVYGIPQARILEYVPFPSPGDLSDPGIEPMPSAWRVNSLPLSHMGSPGKVSKS